MEYDQLSDLDRCCQINAVLRRELGEAEELLRRALDQKVLKDSLEKHIEAFLNRGW